MSENCNLLKVSCVAMAVMFMSSLVPFELFAENAKVKAVRQDAFVNAMSAEAPKVPGNKKEQKRQPSKKGKNPERKEETPAEKKVTISSELIKALDGGKVSLGKASVEIPSEALSTDTEISITYLSSVQETGESLTNVMSNGCGYRFLPAGTKFNKKVTITLPYDPVLNTKPKQLEDVYTYFYDTEKKEWVQLERIEIDKVNCVVRSYTTHFTDMINATLSLPESASPVDVNLNSIKNLEAAKPDSHIIKFNPPKADNTGDASFSFELEVPAGRRGMQPQIAISYSSGGGNGIMGRNFDIRANSSITTDTRHGLPNYDTKDTYMLDGVKLEETLRSPADDGSWVITYTPLKQVNFEKIERYYEKDSKNYWVVTSKDGTKRFFGSGYEKNDASSEGSTEKSNEDSCVGSGDEIFTWNLTKTVDVHDNSINYIYSQDEGYVYLTEIDYGKSKIIFKYDEETRKDIRSDARSKSLVVCRWLLTSVETQNNGKLIRKYSFDYKQGVAQDNRLVKLTVSNGVEGKDNSYEYTFEYEGYQLEDGTKTRLFDEIPAAELEGNPIAFFDKRHVWDNGHPIQTGKSTSSGINFTGSAGVGYGTPFWDVRASLGGNGSSASGDSYVDSTLVDINGDGRPDSVSKTENGKFEVAFNTGRGFETGQTSILVDGFNKNISAESNDSSSFGWNVYGGAGIACAVVGANLGASFAMTYQNSNSYSRMAFMDMDGDGLVDILQSGETSYLSNRGLWGQEDAGDKKLFEQVYISSDLPSIEIKPYLEPTKKEEFQSTYYTLTPFRMWKSPYTGIVAVSQSSEYRSDGEGAASGQKNVNLYTYRNSESTPLVEGTISGSRTFRNEDTFANIDKGDHLYFISQNSQDIKDLTYEWKIGLDYVTVEPFNNGLKIPYFYFPKKYPVISMNLSKNISDEKDAKMWFKAYIKTTEKGKGLSDDEIDWLVDNFYKFNATYNTDSDGTQVFDGYNVRKYLPENNVQLLVDRGYFVPRYITGSKFEELMAAVKNPENGFSNEDIIDFINKFEKSSVNDIYELNISNSEEDFNDNYFENSEHNLSFGTDWKKQNLSVYEVVDTEFRFSNSKVEYYNSEEFNETTVRDIALDSYKHPGTVTQLDGASKVALGKQTYICDVNLDGRTYSLSYNEISEQIEDSEGVVDGLLFDGQEISAEQLASYGISAEKTGDEIDVKFGYNGDSTAIHVSSPDYRACNMSYDEMERIVDDFMKNADIKYSKLEYTNETDENGNEIQMLSGFDEHWFIENADIELREGSSDDGETLNNTIYIDDLFMDDGKILCFSEEQRKDFIEIAYGEMKDNIKTINVEQYKILDASEKAEYEPVYDSESKVTAYEKTLYRYYTPRTKLTQNEKDRLGQIILDYKRNTILSDEDYFGFYENKDGQYILKDYWQTEKTLSDIKKEHEEEIASSFENEGVFDSLVEELIEKDLIGSDFDDEAKSDAVKNFLISSKYETYQEKNERIKAYCEKYAIGKCLVSTITVTYKIDNVYSVKTVEGVKGVSLLSVGDKEMEGKTVRFYEDFNELADLSFSSSDSVMKERLDGTDGEIRIVNKAKNNVLYTCSDDSVTVGSITKFKTLTTNEYDELNDEVNSYVEGASDNILSADDYQKYKEELPKYKKNVDTGLYQYEENSESGDGETDSVTSNAEYYVSNVSDEFLYGGYKGWFFGIWQGNLPDVAKGESFEASLNSYKKSISTENEFNDAKSSQSTSVASTNDSTVRFIYPNDYSLVEMKQSDGSTQADCYSDEVKNNLKNQIFGNVTPDFEYPYMQDNIIHADRYGGDSFYDVLSHYRESKTITFEIQSGFHDYSLPLINKSHTEGTDITPSVSVGLTMPAKVSGGELTEEFTKALKDGKFIDSSSGSSLLSLGQSWGFNNSSSEGLQSVQDINADGIPDFLIINNDNLMVYYGKKSNTETIIYDSASQKIFNNISSLSENTSDVTVSGGSISPGGAIQAMGTAKGKILIKQIGSTNPSAGTTITIGTNSQKKGFIDFNGDGLQDFYSGGVLFNTGDKFESDSIGSSFKSGVNDSISSGKNESFGTNFSIGVGSNLGEASSLLTTASLNLGASYSASSSNTEKMLLDVNGDGLQDSVYLATGSDTMEVRYNTGNGFTDKINYITLPHWNFTDSDISTDNFTKMEGDFVVDKNLQQLTVVGTVFKGFANALKDNGIISNPYGRNFETLADSLDWSSTLTLGVNGSAGINFNYGINIIIPTPIPVYIGTINITVSGGAGANGSTSINGAYVKMIDLDGDGMVDQVMRAGGATYWKRNLMGRVGLLRKINLPQGGSCSIEYGEVLGTPESPGHKYVLSTVTMDDGIIESETSADEGESCHSYTTSYEYEGGYYDRSQKDFYGYETVKTILADGSMQVDKYYNKEYYSKGQVNESYFYNNKIDTSWLTMSVKKLADAPLALVTEESSETKETGSDYSIITSTAYTYDSYGCVTSMTQNFPGNKKLVCEVTYQNIEDKDKYIIGLPVTFAVKDGNENGKTFRHRTGEYDDYGQLTMLSQYYDENHSSCSSLKYDSYGNIKKVTDANGVSLSYTYDGDGMYVEKIAQSGKGTDEYTSTIEYDYDSQTKISETDCNNHTMRYEYDDWQRITKIFTSYDNTVPAVSYEYNTTYNNENRWYAVTNNKVTFDPDDDNVIQTVVEIDGLGRAIRTAKTGYVYEKGDGWNISGVVKYDRKGRTIEEGMTDFISGNGTNDLESLLSTSSKMSEYSTKYVYDSRDRKIETILPDNTESNPSIQTTEYSISSDNTFVTKQTDPMGNRTETYTDAQGNIVYMEKYGKKDSEDSSPIKLTSFSYEYNIMGEMLYADDAKLIGTGKHTVSVAYDMLGRKTYLSSIDSGTQHYLYDDCSNVILETNSVLESTGRDIKYTYDGLNRLVKIDYPEGEGDVTYTYGEPNAADGCAGKIVSITDASGTIAYKYGKLGETIEEDRSINTHLNQGITGVVRNRMKYISDYLGRMQSIEYSGITEDVLNEENKEVITYGYDNGGQVCSVTGTHFNTVFNYVKNIGYDEYGQRVYIEYGNGVETNYKYDAQRRWLSSIKTKTAKDRVLQNLSYNFDKNGNITKYTNDCFDILDMENKGDYCTSQDYKYDGLNQLIYAHGESTYNEHNSLTNDYTSNYYQYFSFDNTGNMLTKQSSHTVNPTQVLSDDDLNYSLDYTYDERYGHRLVKAGSDSDGDGYRYYKYDENGNVIREQDREFSDDTSTNTYEITGIAGTKVEATEYGWGIYDAGEQTDTTIADGYYYRDYTWNSRNQLILSSDSQNVVNYVYGQDGQRTNKYVNGVGETIYFNKMFLYRKDNGNATNGGQTILNIYLGDTRIATKLNIANGPSVDGDKVYYYHSDHLGSASLITDDNGDLYQRIEYTPYGETWIETTSNTGLQYLPYKFTAQERDSETGLYYYGARYLDPKYSRWISTDPALGDYIPVASTNDKAKEKNGNLPGMGGIYNHINSGLYHYAGNNPVKYTDPTGTDIIYQTDDGIEVGRDICDDKNEIHTPSSDQEMMNKNAEEMKNNKGNILLFAVNVKTGGKWDFKDKNNPEHRSHYWFNGELIKAEEFGNLHYGYVGAAGGFSTDLLIDAPGIVQVRNGTADADFKMTNYDDPRDTVNILKGIASYQKPLSTQIMSTGMTLLYKGSGAQRAFKLITSTYFAVKTIKDTLK